MANNDGFTEEDFELAHEKLNTVLNYLQSEIDSVLRGLPWTITVMLPNDIVGTIGTGQKLPNTTWIKLLANAMNMQNQQIFACNEKLVSMEHEAGLNYYQRLSLIHI